MCESWQNYPNQKFNTPHQYSNVCAHMIIMDRPKSNVTWIRPKILIKLVCCICMFKRHSPIILIAAHYKKFSSHKIWQPIQIINR